MASLTWSELKQEADIIISTLKEAGRLLYDPLPNGRNIPPFQPSVTPLSPPIKVRLHYPIRPQRSSSN